MKTIVLLILSTLAVGCQKKPDSVDARMAKLESEIKELKSELEGLDIPGDIDPVTGLPSPLPPPQIPVDPVTGHLVPMPNKPPIVMRVFEIKQDMKVEELLRKVDSGRIDVLVTNLNAWIVSINDEQNKNHERLNALLAWAKQYSYRQPTVVQPSTATDGYKEGIPLSIYNQIAIKAAKEWPEDYSQQEYTIRHEVEAYKKLHP